MTITPGPDGQQPIRVHQQAQRTSGYAVAGLVLSVVWLCGLGSLAGIIVSAIGYRDARNGAANGQNIALAGLILGALGLVFAIYGYWSFTNGIEDAFNGG